MSRVYFSDEAEKIAMRERMVIVAVFLALGLSVGTALALLFVPERGKAFRKSVVEVVRKELDQRRKGSADGAKQPLEKDSKRHRKQVEERTA